MLPTFSHVKFRNTIRHWQFNEVQLSSRKCLYLSTSRYVSNVVIICKSDVYSTVHHCENWRIKNSFKYDFDVGYPKPRNTRIYTVESKHNYLIITQVVLSYKRSYTFRLSLGFSKIVYRGTDGQSPPEHPGRLRSIFSIFKLATFFLKQRFRWQGTTFLICSWNILISLCIAIMIQQMQFDAIHPDVYGELHKKTLRFLTFCWPCISVYLSQ